MEDIDIYVEEETEINITVDENTAYVIEVPGVSAASVLTTTGDLLGFSDAPERHPIGTDGQVLTVNSAADRLIAWEDLPEQITNKIEQGTSSIEIIDVGAGTITTTIDSNEIMTIQNQHQPITISHPQSYLDANTPLVLMEATGTSTSTKGAVLWLDSNRGTGVVDVDVFRVDNTNGEIFSIDNAGGVSVNQGTAVNEFSTDTTLAGNSDVALPTEKAVKTYVDNATAKLSYVTVTQAVNLDTMESDIATNNAKVTNATHTGEVTGSTALTIADNVVDEANLKLDEAPTNGYVLTADSTKSGGMKWAAGGSGSSPLTTKGDLYTYSTADARLPVGTNGYVLTADSSEATGLKWTTVSGASGMTDPMTTRGDIIIRDATNTTNRLAVGTNGQVLTSDGTDVSWEDASGGTSDKIEEGNSSVEVVDAGTGYISHTIDGTEVRRTNPNTTVFSNGGIGLDYDSGVAPAYFLLESNHCVVKNRVYSNTAAHGPSFEFGKGRGTYASTSALADDDRIGIFNTIAYDGNSWQYPASILFEVDGTVSTGNMPARISFATTSTNTAGRTTRFRITNDGTCEPGTDDSQDLGSSSYRWDDIYATNSTIQTSDRRLKEFIEPSELGLDFINNLTPVSFKWRSNTVSGVRTVEICDENGTQIGSEEIPFEETHTYNRTHYGMIAQDVVTTISGLGIDSNDFAGIIYDENTDRYGLRYGEFIGPIIKAVQELSDENKELKSKFNDLETQHALLLKRIEDLEGK